MGQCQVQPGPEPPGGLFRSLVGFQEGKNNSLSMKTSTMMKEIIDDIDEGFDDCIKMSTVKIGKLLKKKIPHKKLMRLIRNTLSKQIGSRQFSICLRKLSKDIK